MWTLTAFWILFGAAIFVTGLVTCVRYRRRLRRAAEVFADDEEAVDVPETAADTQLYPLVPLVADLTELQLGRAGAGGGASRDPTRPAACHLA
ncbi:hypothetical protein G6O67_004270 [Ophiocordyceps sinensis]|uniref:Uncharacterized protein n=2 Tax=Ophiocordyceps sinensis TaxID=72228 RepID=A0A8H4LYC6_9HYPO|nr:hypothetical protein OCS_02517 [Ophiocordyceps sinensis CO18]KAF4507809.1 hypothetical protein G6O67_004270 [Ophiocordyceps sinensis]